MNKSESLAKLAPALVKAQKKMGAALKDAKNPFFKSKYADLNAIIDASVPTLNEEGIAVLQTPQIVDGKAVIQTVLLHESGEFIAGNSEIVAAKSNDPQAAGSATTYSRRYGLQAMVTLKAEDDDAEKAMGRNDSAKVTINYNTSPNVPVDDTGKPNSTHYTTKQAEAEKPKAKVSFMRKGSAAASTTSVGDDI